MNSFTAKGKHNSVFLSILKGEHDSLLPWPFNCPVIFTMMHQDDISKSRTFFLKMIHYTRKTKINTVFFSDVQYLKANANKENRPFVGRPLGERNPAFGSFIHIPLCFAFFMKF